MNEPNVTSEGGDLSDLQATWNLLGRTDPMWAILADPALRGGKWDPTLFFASGNDEVGAVLLSLHQIGIGVKRSRGLDFGCGVGRLTQAFAFHFKQCDGVDIAPSMIEMARAHNRHGERVKYHLNQADDLRIFPDDSFDFVYSNIVLQHMRSEYSKRYIREFVRVLKPGGVAFFHVPSDFAGPPAEAYRLSDDCHAVALSIKHGPRVMRSGQRGHFNVRLTNKGPCTLPAGGGHASGVGGIRVGNHWRKASGKLLVLDDGRQELPFDLGSGQQVDLDVAVVAPRCVGKVLVEFDVVQEGFCWFADRGSASLRKSVYVLPARPLAPAPSRFDAVDRPFEMHAVPKGEVIGVLREAGATLLTTFEEEPAAFHDVRYVATKGTEPD